MLDAINSAVESTEGRTPGALEVLRWLALQSLLCHCVLCQAHLSHRPAAPTAAPTAHCLPTRDRGQASGSHHSPPPPSLIPPGRPSSGSREVSATFEDWLEQVGIKDAMSGALKEQLQVRAAGRGGHGVQ